MPSRSRRNVDKSSRTRRSRRGGATSSLPIDESWDVKIISAHGRLSDNMYVVPNNTYILHLAMAGSSCLKLGWELDNWIYDLPKGQAPGRHGTMFQRLIRAINGGTFLKGGDETIYNTTNSNLTDTVSFYEPGDIVSDLDLSFFNHNIPVFLMGLYQFPIPHTLKKAMFDYNTNLGLFVEANVNALNHDNLNYNKITTISPGWENNEHEKNKAQQLFNIEENLLRDQMFTKNNTRSSVHKILTDVLRPATAEQPRLIIVKACRFVKDPAIKEVARAMSLGVRHHPLGDEKERTRLTVVWLKKLIVDAIQEFKSTNNNRDEKVSIVLDFFRILNEFEGGHTVPRDFIWTLLRRITALTALGIREDFRTLLKLNP